MLIKFTRPACPRSIIISRRVLTRYLIERQGYVTTQ